MIIVVDDGSMDSTPKILERKASMNLKVIPLRIENRRYKIKGYNVSLATRKAYEILFDMETSLDYVFNLDADCVIPSNYVETLIEEMELYPNLAICAGFSDKRPEQRNIKNYATNAARLYRANFCKKLMPYPVMYAHDSYMVYQALYKGWKVKTMQICFEELRIYRRSIFGCFLSGRFGYRNGFTIPELFIKTIKCMRKKPYVIGSLVEFLTYITYSLTNNRIADKNYRKYVKNYRNYGILRSRVRTV
jgi:glycosyltransferase involved in cell wall biosynthesis